MSLPTSVTEANVACTEVDVACTDADMALSTTAFGKDESLPKRNLLILSQLDGPAAPKKRIEVASDSFMHAPLGSGDIAQLVELRSCNWAVAIMGWVSNCPGGNDSILYLNR
ncbi:hypothetical protein GQ457_18G023870 [Hibiscus cannabinus]